MTRSPRPPTRHLRLEHLEDRTTPAMFIVSNLNDAGTGSLRDAIAQAEVAASPDTIVFAGAAVGGTVFLSTFTNMPANTAAVPQPAGPSAFIVTSAITIQGTGETITRTGEGAFRLFQVTAAGNLTLQNLTLTNGLAQGGAGGVGGGGAGSGGAAGLGGAVYNQGMLSISGSTLTGNQAIGGANTGGGVVVGGGLGGPGDSAGNGGLPNGVVVVGVVVGGGGGRGSAGGFGGGGGTGVGTGGFGGGGGGVGGAVFNQGGTVTVVNSTITANTAQGGNSSGTGQNGGAFGGGVFNLNGTLTLTNVTIAGNTVAPGTGGAAHTSSGSALFNASVNVGTVTPTQTATVTVANSIFSGIGAAVSNYKAPAPPETATINGTGPNIATVAVLNNGGTLSGTPFTVVDPNIGQLQNNGGFTSTMLPNLGSPALNVGSNAATAGLATDQRSAGFFRVSNGMVDIGAVEIQPAPVPLVVAPTALSAGQVGTAYTQTITATGPTGPFTFAVTAGALPAGLSLSTAGALSGTPSTSGTASFTVTATNPALAAGSQSYAVTIDPPAPPPPGGGSLAPLAVGGVANGSVVRFAPSGGQYGTTPIATLSPFGTIPTSVRTATADVNGDTIPDTILVTGPGVPIRLAVISGAGNTTVLVAPFDPFGGDFTGGGYVASADLDADGRAEFVVTPDEGGGPRVTIFSLVNGSPVVRANFFGIDDAAFRGGARAAVGDINGDGVADLAVAAGFQGGPRTALFNGTTLFATPARLTGDFFGFPGADATTLRNGVFLALGDVDGDGFADLVLGGGPGGAPRVFVLSGAKLAAGDVAGAQAAPIANFFVANDTADRGGVRLAVKSADGDAKADVITGSGEGRPSQVRVYLGKNFAGAGEPATFQNLDPFGTTLPGGVFVG